MSPGLTFMLRVQKDFSLYFVLYSLASFFLVSDEFILLYNKSLFA
jgi:hypothetical protein